MTDYICIKTYLHRHEAEMDRDFLEASSIAAIILAGDLGGILPSLLWGKSVELMVVADQAGRALELLNPSDQESQP
ncbi:hypothetical protein ACFL4K_00735 [Candidatus Neomarinimicrobiota bacterium]